METSKFQHSTSREHQTANHQTKERHPTSARHWNLKFGASLVLGAWCLVLPPCETVFAQGTAFTYQGRLNNNGSPASGIYNLQFSLFNVNSGGSAVAGPVNTNGVAITNGLFTVLIDFGSGVFAGATNWLQIGVETNGGGSFTTLSPRQQLTPTPYAIFAENVTASGISGTIPAANFGGSYNNAVSFNNGADSFDGTFVGQFFGSIFTGGIFTGTFLGSGSGLGDVWHTGGNSGTTAGLNFVGTTDNQPLELHVNGQRVLRLTPDLTTNSSPDIIGGSPVNTVAPGLVGATIGGGGATIYGGLPGTNLILGDFNTIAGGWGNTTGNTNFDVSEATIAGGAQNTASGVSSFIGGGAFNLAYDNNAVVAGGLRNRAGFHSFVGSGYGNSADGVEAAIGGGHLNNIQTNTVLSTIGGGWGNTIQGNNYEAGATIGGGTINTIGPSTIFDGENPYGYVSSYSTIGGGFVNQIQSNSVYSTIGGGFQNTILANAARSVIAGGYANIASGTLATIAGGDQNWAANNALAAGHRAKAYNSGAFVWADSIDADFASTANNQFNVRANGGVVFVTGGAGMTLDGQPIVSGTYSNTVTLTNVGNTFAGNGTGLTNVNAALLNGLASSAFAPASGSANYIQNQNASPQVASFDISGNAQVAGLFRSGSETGASDSPSPAGLVIRRVNSLNATAGQVIARSDLLQLERDGSNGGLIIAYPAGAGEQTITAMGINNTGGQVNFFDTLLNQTTAGTVQIYLNSQNVVYAQITFGNTYLGGHVTQVTISRAYNDFYWVGTVTSTYNQ